MFLGLYVHGGINMVEHTERSALALDITRWIEIRDGHIPFFIGEKQGELCKIVGCEKCPKSLIGHPCLEKRSTWSTYRQLIGLYKRKRYLEKVQSDFSDGKGEDEQIVMHECISQFVKELERALEFIDR